MPADLTVTGPATASLTLGVDGDSVYNTVRITPNPTAEGDVTVQVNATTVQDFALNDNTASNMPSVHVDTIVPTVAISGAPDIEKNVFQGGQSSRDVSKKPLPSNGWDIGS